jgi:hypothetical protein
MSRKIIDPYYLLFVALVLAACAQPEPTPTVAVLPTPTSTPSAPLVILLAPPDSDPQLAAVAAELISSYAVTNGLQFEQRSLLNPAELPTSLSKLVVLAPDPGTAALVSGLPQTQVVTIGFTVENAGPNIVGIPLGGADSASSAFIAGYIAAISAEDWRAGMLYTESSAALVNDFTSGAEYFCGSCAPFLQPLIEYPVAAQAADAQNWQSAADQLVSQLVKVVYLAPELEAGGAAQYLASSGVLIIGSGAPPAEIANSWVVSVSSDQASALREVLTLALNGQPFESTSSLSLTNANPNLFSESRQANVATVIQDLMSGYIQLPVD